MRDTFVRVIMGLFLVLGVSLSYAGPGCCSHHGGVNGCNTSNNHQLCKDGTTSPTCPCTGTTTKKTTSSSWFKPKSTTTTKQTTTAPATTETSAPAATSTTATTTTTVKQKGCCSRHGGVVGCKGGFALCKDKSVSSTCKC